MRDFLQIWFKGLFSGIEGLDAAAREKLFRACAKECADSAPLAWYKKAFAASGGDIGRFFQALGEIDGIMTVEITPGTVYDICYAQCGCDLYRSGLVNSGCLCECSRQSILYGLSQILPGLTFTVEEKSTILRGDDMCRFRITIKDKGYPLFFSK